MTIFLLTAEHVTMAAAGNLGYRPKIRDDGALAAAVARPALRSDDGDDLYPGVWTKAGALLVSIVQLRPYVTGNLVAAWAAARAMLYIGGALSGRSLHVDPDAAADLVRRVDAGALTDVGEVAACLQSLCR